MVATFIVVELDNRLFDQSLPRYQRRSQQTFLAQDLVIGFVVGSVLFWGLLDLWGVYAG